MKFRLSAVVLLALAAAACGETAISPTAPTAAAAPPFNDLRWDVFSPAPGCAVAKPVPMLANVPPDSREATAAGVRALWRVDDGGPAATVQRFIAGDFHRFEKVYAICSWSTVERRIDR